MKKSVFFILLLVTSFAQASPSYNTLKVVDGLVATCDGPLDVFNNRYGVYSAQAQNIEVKKDILHLTIVLSFFNCFEQNGKYVLAPNAPLHTFFLRFK